MVKNRKKKGSAREATSLDVEDRESRFDTSKPQFRKQHQRDNKVILDDRFATVLTDPRFKLDVQDKYGRRKREKGKNTKDELSGFYTVESSVRETEDAARLREKSDEHTPVDNRSEEDNNDSSSDETGDHNNDQPSSRIAYLTALSRGQLDLSSSSSSSSEGEDTDSDNDAEADDESHHSLHDKGLSEEGDNEYVKEVPGVLDPSSADFNIELTSDATPYLAVLNLDWSHVRAVDVYALLSSFSPPGAVVRVRVFLSDFGKQKLAEEERMGPGIWKDATRSVGSETHSSGEENDDLADDSETTSDDESGDEEDPLTMEEHLPNTGDINSGFDPEKLRAYEAAKLKYYFAIVEFTSPEVADAVYKEVDGMEFEHSSASIDLRAIQRSELNGVIEGRDVRDEATRLPSNYMPPDFIVGALQQTNVQCTWEGGDQDRQKTLTKYTSRETWQSLAESDDLKAYLASDVSSDEDVGSDNEKAINKRKLLGLKSDDEEIGSRDSDGPQASGSESESDSEDEKLSKEVTFVPGQKKSDLENKIRSKLQSNGGPEELTPWELYQLKRKEKRKERRQAARSQRKSKGSSSDEEESLAQGGDLSDKQTREELELLMAGESHEENARDYDMRTLQRLEKYKDKKLRGSRKRKEDERAAGATGVDFELDVRDERFKAVLEGDDDRFGIDRTNPSYKETPTMKLILKEQARRRKSKKQRQESSERTVVPNVSADKLSVQKGTGAAALSALINRIKAKVQT